MAFLKGGGGDGGAPAQPHRAGDLRQQGRAPRASPPGHGPGGGAVPQNRAWQARKKQARRELTPAVPAPAQGAGAALRQPPLRPGGGGGGEAAAAGARPVPRWRAGAGAVFRPGAGKIYALLCQRHREGAPRSWPPRRGALPGGDEPPGKRDGSAGGLAHSAQALRDYIEIIETEALKRAGRAQAPPAGGTGEVQRKKSVWRITA